MTGLGIAGLALVLVAVVGWLWNEARKYEESTSNARSARPNLLDYHAERARREKLARMAQRRRNIAQMRGEML